jgi:hypothetical protein
MRFSKLATCAVVLACALFGAGVEARSDIHRHDHGAHQGTYEGQFAGGETPLRRHVHLSLPGCSRGMLPPCSPFPGHVGHSSPAGSTLHTAESQELFARIHEELEARNYSRPLSTSNGGVHGVDVSQWAGASTWKCVKGAGQRFAIVRGYQEVS